MAQAVLQTIDTIDRPSHFHTGDSFPLHRLKAIIESTVADVFAIDVGRLQSGSRGQAPVAQARQVAMYLMHCAFGISLTEIGYAFARDRTTVSHACRLIEDRRDTASFDFLLTNLEEIVCHRARVSICRLGR